MSAPCYAPDAAIAALHLSHLGLGSEELPAPSSTTAQRRIAAAAPPRQCNTPAMAAIVSALGFSVDEPIARVIEDGKDAACAALLEDGPATATARWMVAAVVAAEGGGVAAQEHRRPLDALVSSAVTKLDFHARAGRSASDGPCEPAHLLDHALRLGAWIAGRCRALAAATLELEAMTGVAVGPLVSRAEECSLGDLDEAVSALFGRVCLAPALEARGDVALFRCVEAVLAFTADRRALGPGDGAVAALLLDPPVLRCWADAEVRCAHATLADLATAQWPAPPASAPWQAKLHPAVRLAPRLAVAQATRFAEAGVGRSAAASAVASTLQPLVAALGCAAEAVGSRVLAPPRHSSQPAGFAALFASPSVTATPVADRALSELCAVVAPSEYLHGVLMGEVAAALPVGAEDDAVAALADLAALTKDDAVRQITAALQCSPEAKAVAARVHAEPFVVSGPTAAVVAAALAEPSVAEPSVAEPPVVRSHSPGADRMASSTSTSFSPSSDAASEESSERFETPPDTAEAPAPRDADGDGWSDEWSDGDDIR